MSAKPISVFFLFRILNIQYLKEVQNLHELIHILVLYGEFPACSLLLNTSSLGFSSLCLRERLWQHSVNRENGITSGRDLASIPLCLWHPPERRWEYDSLFPKPRGSSFPCKSREILRKWLSMAHILGYHLVAPTWLRMDVTDSQSQGLITGILTWSLCP